nr:MAG TPA: hypothetical protein [Caudoviricetes sp.]
MVIVHHDSPSMVCRYSESGHITGHEPEQTFDSVRTASFPSRHAKKTEIFYNRKKRNKETSYF